MLKRPARSGEGSGTMRATYEARAQSAPGGCTPQALARFFRVLGDPTRLQILELLWERERSVGELVELIGVPQGRVSNHLACLKWCRFVGSERRGRRVFYRVTDQRVRRLLSEGRELAGENCDHLESCGRIGPDWI